MLLHPVGLLILCNVVWLHVEQCSVLNIMFSSFKQEWVALLLHDVQCTKWMCLYPTSLRYLGMYIICTWCTLYQYKAVHDPIWLVKEVGWIWEGGRGSVFTHYNDLTTVLTLWSDHGGRSPWFDHQDQYGCLGCKHYHEEFVILSIVDFQCWSRNRVLSLKL